MTPKAVSGWYRNAFMGAALISFYVLEQQWPQVAMWSFVLVTLTLGMGHGALDAVLLLKQFKPQSFAVMWSLVYLVVVVTVGWLLSLSFSLALLALLLMSVWHFGELHRNHLALRLVVGGASVMSPALLHGDALSQLLRGTSSHDATWILTVWTILAWAWAALVCVVALGQIFKALVRGRLAYADVGVDVGPITDHRKAALQEIFIVLCLGLVFSPLLQFAIYFGFYHCPAHIARVYRAVLRHGNSADTRAHWAWTLSMLSTALLMAALWYWLPMSDGVALNLDAHLLQWLVVALGAVTAPHLMLVSHSSKWLGQ